MVWVPLKIPNVESEQFRFSCTVKILLLIQHLDVKHNCSFVDLCELNQCHNGATCTGSPTTYRCECPSNYKGKHCDEPGA